MTDKFQEEIFAFIDALRAEGVEFHEILSAFSQIAKSRNDIPTDKREEVSQLLEQAAAEHKKMISCQE